MILLLACLAALWIGPLVYAVTKSRPGVAANFRDETPLFGALPELDSMAVAGVLTELEDRLGIIIDDDEVDGDLFASFGSLTRFLAAKVAG